MCRARKDATAASPAPMPLLVHTVCAGNSAAAAMADVWLFCRTRRRHADGARSALKLPRLGLLRRDLALRFARERDILRAWNIRTSHAFRTPGVSADGLPYLAMNTSTAARSRTLRHAAPGYRCAAEAVRTGFRPVQYAHAPSCHPSRPQAIEHPVTADGQARLLDFGIAQIVGRSTKPRAKRI